MLLMQELDQTGRLLDLARDQTTASERITEGGRTRLRGLLDAGDPYGEVREAWHAKETIRGVYDIPDYTTGVVTVCRLALD